MTDNVTVTIEGVDELFKKLGAIEGVKALRKPMDASLIELETYMKYYPPKPGARAGTAISPVRFTTKAGRSVSFMALSSGWTRNKRGKAVYTGYVRTGKLGQRWSEADAKQVSESVDGITGTLTNNIEYAMYVQSAAKQARIHQGRWRTDAMAIEKYRSKIVQRFNDAIAEALK